MAEMYLVLIETSGNQGYIFSTNRLSENVGASELTYQAGTYWVVQAVAAQNKEVMPKDWRKPEQFRQFLRKQKPLSENSEQKAEVIVAASGKALILAKDKEIARKIISEVTRTALLKAPGLDIAGVYEDFEWNEEDPTSLSQAIKRVHKTFEKVRSRRPSPENRFLRLPIVASCAVSGLPASQIGKDPNNRPQLISQVSYVKRDFASKGVKRLQEIANPNPLAQDINKLEKVFDSEDMAWVAVVHADGNGLGQIFLNFQKHIDKGSTTRDYIHKFREFSLALDECTEAAFRTALKVLPNDKEFLPIVPLIVGGDDLTVVCHGEYALEFTRVFLQKFEQETAGKPAISEIAERAFATDHLSACAGIAIVKRHFPFSVAYKLAENLIKSAKEVKKKVIKKDSTNTPFPCSAIDFHILRDTSGADLSAIREKLEPEEYTKLYNRPYVVTEPDRDKIQEDQPPHEDIGMSWIKPRKWDELTSWVNVIQSSPEVLPSSQAHAIRTALYLGKAQSEAQCQLIQNRYPDFKKFLEEEHKALLFREEKAKDSQDRVKVYSVTPFLDALDTQDFLKKAEVAQ